MKICFCTPRYPPNIRGGGEISCKLLFDNLKKKVDIELIKEYSYYQFYRFMKKNYKKYDIFHSYNNNYSFILGYFTKKHGIKTISNLNGFTFSNINIKNNIFRKLINYNTKIIVLSDDIKKMWACRNISLDKIIVIPNMFDPCFKVLPKKKNDIKTFYFIGNYSKWRDLDDADRFCKSHGINLRVIGDGWSLGEGVKVKDMPVVYSECDFYLYFARYMAFSRSMIEAIQNNCIPIVNGDTNNFGFLKDFVYNENDFDKVFSNYDKFYSDTFKAKSLLYKYFNPNVISDKYVNIYENILN